MFKRLRLSQDRIIALDVHTTSPGEEKAAKENGDTIRRMNDPGNDLYRRANQFYLRSRLMRMRRSSSSIV